MSFPLGQPDGGSVPPDCTKEPMTLSELLGGTSFVSASGRTYRLFGNEDKSLDLPTIPAIPPILNASKMAAVTLEEALQQIASFSQPGVNEKVREQPIADPPTLQLFPTLGETAPHKLVRQEKTLPNESLSVKDILNEVSQNLPKRPEEKRTPLRVVPEHVEEPFIVPFAKPELPPEEKLETKNVVLKIVSDLIPEIHLPNIFRKCRKICRKEKTSYRKPFSLPAPCIDNEIRERIVVERPDRPAIDPVAPAIVFVPGFHIMPEEPAIVSEPKPDIDHSTFRWSAQLDSLKQTASNQTRMLTDHLIVQSNQGTKVICFKSIFPGDGCSTILLCAARTLTERNYRVLLLDIHYRHVDLPKQLNLSGNLDSGNEVITLNNRLGLWVWQKSKTTEKNRVTLAEVITTNREKYDLILLDDGSVTESPLTEFVEFWNHAALDGVVLVSNTKRTSEIPVSHIARRFRQRRIHLIGITENYV